MGKNKFIRKILKIELNLVNDCMQSLDGEEVWSVGFNDVLQALSSMIVGPSIRAIVTDKHREKPLSDWILQNCDTYLHIYHIDPAQMNEEEDDTTQTHPSSKQA